MFYWGSGSTLGFLTCLGYGIFLIGGYFLWRHRSEFAFWVDDEIFTLKRNLSRYVAVGPFYERRGESRLIVIPAGLLRSAIRMPRRRFSWGAFLLFVGVLLSALDFFI